MPPDLILSAPFPITRPSYRRKFWRDISGQTGYAQRKAQFLNAQTDGAGRTADRHQAPLKAIRTTSSTGVIPLGTFWKGAGSRR
jgi:hypothetical protein